MFFNSLSTWKKNTLSKIPIFFKPAQSQRQVWVNLLCQQFLITCLCPHLIKYCFHKNLQHSTIQQLTVRQNLFKGSTYTVGVQHSLTRGERKLCLSPFKKSSNPILSSVPKRESKATIELGRQGNRWICVDKSKSYVIRIRWQHSQQSVNMIIQSLPYHCKIYCVSH